MIFATIVRGISIRRLVTASALVLTVSVTAGTQVAQGLGNQYWDDVAAGQCDVQNALGGTDKCDLTAYNMALTEANTSSVPRGTTTVRFYFHNIITDPSNPSRPLAGSSQFTNSYVHFDLQGDMYCPGYAGASPALNKRDRLVGGYYAPGGNGYNNATSSTTLVAGDQVTDFYLTEFDGTQQHLSSAGEYRTGPGYCDSSGANYTKRVNLSPNDLFHEPGFPADVFYAELNAVPVTSIQGRPFGPSAGTCAPPTPNQCEGVTNSFRAVFDTSEADGGTYKEIGSGSSGDDFNDTFRNNEPSNDNIGTPTAALHYSVDARFGADCRVVNGNTGPYHIVLYDVDDSRNAGDIIKAELIRHHTNAGGAPVTQALVGGLVPSNKSGGTAGTWSGDLGAAWKPQYSDGYAVKVDQSSDSYETLNFTASSGDTYEFYLLEIRSDLVNQIGVPFDSVYFGNPCHAAVQPEVSITQPNVQPNSLVTMNADLRNTDNVDIKQADSVRRAWYDANGNGLLDGTEVASAPYGQTDAPTNTPVPANKIVGNGAAPFPTWNIQVPANPALGSNMCTQLFIIPGSVNPSGADVGPIATTCVPIQQAAAKPYFSVLGGDVAVGAGIGACTPHSPISGTSIYGNNAGGPPNPYNGSGSQLAALTLGVIKNFATDKYQNGQTGATWFDTLTGSTAPIAESGRNLSFANYPTNGQYGSSAGFTNWCLDDYYGNVKLAGANGLAATTTVASIRPGVNTYTGTFLTIGGGMMPAGQKSVVRATGDVYITGSILYGTPATPGDIPSLQVITNGNIYVAGGLGGGVTELDGFYVAQGRLVGGVQTGGLFVTCSGLVGGLPKGLDTTNTATATLISNCGARLTVYGSVAAGMALVPNRTSGDFMGASSQPEAPAEVFYYNPQAWLAAPPASGGLGKWQAVTSLPPIL